MFEMLATSSIWIVKRVDLARNLTIHIKTVDLKRTEKRNKTK